MRALVIGGAGAAGSRIVEELDRRGHEVTVASRRPPTTALASVRLDASDVERVAVAAAGADVVVAATRPAPGKEVEVEDVTPSLATAVGRAGVRLVVVGGAAPLRVPGSGRTALEDPAFVPVAIRPIAAASTRQLELLRTAGRGVDWAYIAPAAHFAPGEARGRYRRHVGDEAGADLVIAEDGSSRISMEDHALAVCDEIERPTVVRRVISVGW